MTLNNTETRTADRSVSLFPTGISEHLWMNNVEHDWLVAKNWLANILACQNIATPKICLFFANFVRWSK